MIQLIPRIVFVLTLFAIGSQAAFAQNSQTVPLERDPATQGSVPYREAVRRFIAKEQGKIVGGKQAPPNMFDWQVSLGVSWIADPYWAHFCGGSVYSDKWIITAAHCVTDLTPSKLIVTAGTNRLVDGVTRRNVRRIIVNRNYNAKTNDNDIALIELLDSLPLGVKIKSLPLLGPSDEASVLVEGAKLTVTGWGATEEGGSQVRDLRYIDDLPLVPNDFCNQPLSYDGKITQNMICAGVTAGGKDSCQGDSGGPLTSNTVSGPTLAGVVSWGEGCAQPNKVGVYTRVARYVDWIRACVSDGASCNRP
jgi:secreted trypsin-like serine protease